MTKAGKAFRNFCSVLLLTTSALLASNELKAQTITIDGNPSDWPAVLANVSNPFKAHVLDTVDNCNDNVWTSGSHVTDAVSSWNWDAGNTSDKTDMRNTGVALIGHKLYVCADLFSANGDAAIGFWLLKGGGAPVAGGNFSGVHQDGDLLICMFFTHGHTTATPALYRWSAGAAVAVSLGTGAAAAATNDGTCSVPSGWPYTPKSGTAGTYPSSSFFEGFVNLDSTGIVFDGCFNSYIALTWQSQSMSASMADLSFGKLPVLPSVTADDRAVCTGSNATFTAFATGGTAPYQYSWNSGSYSATSTLTVTAPSSSANEIVRVKDANGCLSVPDTARLTVNAVPNVNAISSLTYCSGNAASAIAFSGTVAGTTFSWSGTASVGFGTTGSGSIAAFTATNTATSAVTDIVTVTPSTVGCSGTAKTFSVTVSPSPAAGTLAGAEATCVETTSTYTSTVPGGVWTSSATGVATVSTAGVVSGIAQGTAKITYTVTNSCGSAFVVRTATVRALPVAGTISGAATVCEGASLSLSNAAGSVVWSSSSTATATISAGGSVTGVAAGTTTISYTVTNTCGSVAATRIQTVAALPAADTITGTATTCTGVITTLTNAAIGGVWTSGATSIATVNATGAVTGVATGKATISYTVTNSCGTARALKVVTVGVLSSAGTITGVASACAGATTALHVSADGGVWSSSATSMATVNVTGTVTGVAQGTATISYSVTNSCGTASATKVVTINPLPNAGSITGVASMCAGAATTLTNIISGGSWTSTSADVATVTVSGGGASSPGSLTGVASTVTGVSAGTATISYTVTNGCGVASATKMITVNPLPNAGSISGTTTLCATAAAALSNTAAAGAWSSSANSIATVDAAGVVTGIAAGTATISYTVANSCGTATATKVIAINPLPDAGSITGTATVCEESLITLTNTVSTGAWSSSASAIAAIASTGVVTGVSAGTATISYKAKNGCGVAIATTVVTVNPLPDAGSISGSTTVCEAATTNMSNGTAGGAWTSSSPAATIDATGVVTGVSAGSATISYMVSNSCGSAVTKSALIVNPLPVAGMISGTATVCAGSVINLTDDAFDGVWSSSTIGTSTVDATGAVTGVSAGTATISFTVTNSCGVANATKVVTLNPLPNAGAIPGLASVCAGATVTLYAAVSGGVWSSDATDVATIDAAGVVTGVAAGNANISYIVTNSCGVANVTRGIIVNPLPNAGAVPGAASVCAGSSATLAAAVSGGVWSSDATGVITIDAAGVVTGLVAGTAYVSYTVTNSCGVANTTKVMIVNPLPNAGAITGATTLCAGTTVALVNTAADGTWSASEASASVSASGIVSGLAAGTATISYTVTNSCGTAVTTNMVTVNPLPVAGAITGTANTCLGTPITLTNASSGGTWSSSAAGIANVNASGVVTGVVAGTAAISYKVTNGCGFATATRIVTVNSLPNAGTITGAATICAGTNRLLSNTATGGIWTSGTPSIATVSATGLVSAIAGGVATISYTATNSSCSATATAFVLVNPTPFVSPIMGGSHVRYGADTTLTDSVAGGTWSASNSYATVTGGLVHGVYPGTVTISYSLSNCCGATVVTKVVAIDSPRKYVSAITGPSFLSCVGSVTAYWNATSGGVFSIVAADTGVAKTTPVGQVTGISAGTAVLSYTYMGTTTTSVLTIYPTPAAITGSHTVCNGRQITLYNVTPGGVWTSGIPSVATIGAAEGVVTASNPGVVPMYYTLVAPAGCRVQYNVTVNPNPSGISGPTSVCSGSAITLANATPGGTWSGSNDHASINATGVVTGLSVGGVDFTYTLGTGCFSTRIIGINDVPAPINGNMNVCKGLVTFMSDLTGTALSWTSSTPAVATISASGAVTGVTEGTTTITYKVTTGCYTTAIVTVNPAPVVPAILGAATVCSGTPSVLSELTPGGTWTSDHTTIMTIGSSTGIVTAVSATGSATIKYLVTNSFGCSASVTKLITVTAAAARKAATTTTTTVGTTMEIAADIRNGEWTSSDDNIAMIDGFGNVSALSEGTVTITHVATDADGQVTTEVTNVVISQLPIEAALVPNPNKGSFVLKGTTGSAFDATVNYEITNMAGQIVYRNSGFTTNGVIDQSFTLDGNFTNGMYVLIVRCSDQRKTFNFVVEK